NSGQNLRTKEGWEAILDHLYDQHNCNDWESFWSTFDLAECPSDDGAYWIGVIANSNVALNGKAKTGHNTAVVRMHSIALTATDRTRSSAAHELMHCLGYQHVNVGCAGQNPDGPYDGHPDNGNVVDIPFDPFWNNTVGTSAPGSVQDIMTYGCTRWTSEY